MNGPLMNNNHVQCVLLHYPLIMYCVQRITEVTTDRQISPGVLATSLMSSLGSGIMCRIPHYTRDFRNLRNQKSVGLESDESSGHS